MTVITRRTLGEQKLQQERETEQIKRLSEAKNQEDKESSQPFLRDRRPAPSNHRGEGMPETALMGARR